MHKYDYSEGFRPYLAPFRQGGVKSIS